MRELAIAAVWLFVSGALYFIEPEMQGQWLPYVERGKWIALALAGINALRPVVKWLGLRTLRKVGLISPAPNYDLDDSPPPRPIVRDEPPDERIQPPPPPPGSIKA